ncbi:RidA family protein [Algihabitans albus]|uniref:RidA family protein n=1 Tax=Algihabitans albus TaxID=2164067 RepID=UPI000E5CE139|nr:RidA family protein [Algihabitans albus]
MVETLHPCYSPTGAPKPFSTYSPMVEISAGRRSFHVSGQVGVRLDGSLPNSGEDQMRQAWVNLLAVLEGAGLGPQHLVKVVGYITRPELTPAFRKTRDELLAGARPASTLVGVPFLAQPDWQVEIEAVAAI